jgi:prepilin peptidase CpaA
MFINEIWSLVVIFYILTFAVAMFLAAYSDIRHMKIPNRISLFVLASWFLGLMFFWQGTWHAAVSIGIGVVVFCIALSLYAFQIIGGGDAKLVSAVSLWAGPAFISEFLLVTALSGGIVALVAIIVRRLGNLAAAQPSLQAIVGLQEDRIELPYGVAIAAGGIWVALRLLGI